MLLAMGGTATLLVFAFLHNLRYLYPALPLFSIALGGLLTEGACVFIAAALIALNMWFLPASGWYHNDFALFRRDDVARVIEISAPERNLSHT